MAGYVPRRQRKEARKLARQMMREKALPPSVAAADSAGDVSFAALQDRLDCLTEELDRLERVRFRIDSQISARLEELPEVDAPDLESPAKADAPPKAESVVRAPPASDLYRKSPAYFPRLPAKPAVPVSKSIRPDAIVCLIDGVPRKMLHRHLRAKYGVSPEEYRRHFGLPSDYPMTAPGYSRQKSMEAKHLGLGTPKMYTHTHGRKAGAGKKKAKSGA